MRSLTPPTTLLHQPTPCPKCKPLPLERRQRSGVWVCGQQLWRVISDPQAHLYHKRGDAICWEIGLWERAKEMGVEFLIVHLDGHILTTDRQTFERRAFRFAYPNWSEQIGMARRHWSQYKSAADVGFQFALALEGAT